MIRLIHHYPLQDAFVSPPNHRSQLSRAKEHVSSCPAGRPRGHRSGLTNRGLAPAEMEIFRFVWDMFGSEIGEVQDRIVGKMGRSIEVLGHFYRCAWDVFFSGLTFGDLVEKKESLWRSEENHRFSQMFSKSNYRCGKPWVLPEKSCGKPWVFPLLNGISHMISLVKRPLLWQRLVIRFIDLHMFKTWWHNA